MQFKQLCKSGKENPNPSCCPLSPRTTPFPDEKAILGVIYGVLLGADMNGATPLGAWGCSVMALISLVRPAAHKAPSKAPRVARVLRQHTPPHGARWPVDGAQRPRAPVPACWCSPTPDIWSESSCCQGQAYRCGLQVPRSPLIIKKNGVTSGLNWIRACVSLSDPGTFCAAGANQNRSRLDSRVCNANPHVSNPD